MESRQAHPPRSYGSFDISGSASVIAGDNQCTTVSIENSTLNIFCNGFCGKTVTMYAKGRLCETALALPFRSFHGAGASRRDHRVPEPVRQYQIHPRSDIAVKNPYHDTKYQKRVRPISTGLQNEIGTVTVGDMGHAGVKILATGSKSQLVPGRQHVTGTQVDKQTLVVKDRLTNSNILSGSKSNGNHRCQALSTGVRIQFEGCLTITFQDDLTKLCTFARDENWQRVFFLRTTGPGWSDATCAEIYMPGSEVDNRIKHGLINRRRKKPRLEWVLKDLGTQGQRLLNHMVREVNRCDPSGFEWYVVAVDNEYPADTRETGEITAFMVVLARHLPQRV